jgi:hypothetical protein
MPKMIKTVAASCAAVLLLGSCSGIGDGASPESLKILQVTPDTTFDEAFIRGEQIPGQAYTCVRGVLQAFIFFDDGDVGNFTRRVKWTSSDTSVLTVSNFDEPVPGNPDNRFDYGSIAPLAAGTATVTAKYLDMTATIPVTVDEAGAITITPNDLKMAPRSFQQLQSTAMIDGRKTDLTAQTIFEFTDAEAEEVADFATLSETGSIGAIAPSAPLPITGRLNVQSGACATKAGAIAEANVQVVAIPTPPSPNPQKLGLRLEPEDGYEATLAEGTSQFLKLIARFGDSNGDGDSDDPNEFQDLSFQPGAVGAFTSSDADVASFIGSTLLGRGTLIYAVPDQETTAGTPESDGTTDLSAVYGARPSDTPPEAGTTSNTLPLLVRDVLLRSIEITASPERVSEDGICEVNQTTYGPVPSELTGGKFLCLRATGTFGPDAAGADYVQDITKDVVWTTKASGTLGITSGRVVGAGILASATRAPTSGTQCVNATTCAEEITATFTTNQTNATTGVAITVVKTVPITVLIPEATD